MENFEEMLAKNIIYLRKQSKMTQGELAEKIGYSDKTVSKWETGEAVPDVKTLILICEVFNVSLNDITSGPINERLTKQVKEEKRSNGNKLTISLLAVSLVWILATVLFVYSNLIYKTNIWIVFVWAFPCSFVLAIIFNAIWGKRFFTFVFVSFFMWTLITAIFVSVIKMHVWPLFILGAPGQVAIVLWSRLKPKNKK